MSKIVCLQKGGRWREEM